MDYEPGELRCVAPGAEDVLATPGSATHLQLTPDVSTLPADGQAVAQVEVALLDDSGRPVCADEEVFYQLTGDGELLGIENGRPDDLTPYAQKSRLTRNGRAVVYLRSGLMKGSLELRAYTRSGLTARCVVRVG